MKRVIAATISFLPLVAVFLLPKPASAEVVLRSPNFGRAPIVVERRDDDRWNNDRRDNDHRDNDRRDNDRWNNDRRDNDRRVYVPGHWDTSGRVRRWIPGHYEER